MEFSGDCWQADSSHGPVIKINGQKRQTYLVSVLDDASRIITHAQFFFNDNDVNFQIVLKKAISKYGLPKRLFVDNGGPYKNDQLSVIDVKGKMNEQKPLALDISQLSDNT